MHDDTVTLLFMPGLMNCQFDKGKVKLGLYEWDEGQSHLLVPHSYNPNLTSGSSGPRQIDNFVGLAACDTGRLQSTLIRNMQQCHLDPYAYIPPERIVID